MSSEPLFPFPPTFYGEVSEHERMRVTVDANLFGVSMFNEKPEHVLNVAIMLMVMATSGFDDKQDVADVISKAAECVTKSYDAFLAWQKAGEPV
jgi:hypothetical protein